MILKQKALRDTRGQDLVEYALIAGFLAVTTGALMPGLAAGISEIFLQIGSVMVQAPSQSGSGVY